MAQALYRKYRPQKLDDVLGQETNVEILKNAAKTGRLGQAYIFYGARGTGKTTTARLIAKLLNCEKRRTDPEFAKLGEPCNECRECLAIDAQNSFDVVEIDAASNRGIDEIRNLKENIRTSPASAEHKVYIIDEAHMLTGAAFNALLKTLEEPPKHAVIILATTEFEKLPPTITSRAQRFVFKKLTKATIIEKLRSIAKKEKIKIDEPAIELIAAAAEGSFRDAESLLDQISSLGNAIGAGGTAAGAKGITLADAERVTGRTGLKKVHELAEFIIKKDVKGALGYLNELNEDGHNLVQFTKDLIHYLRKVLSLKINPSLKAIMERDLTKDEVAAAIALGAAADTAPLVKMIKALIRAYAEMRYSPFAIVPLEVALVEQLS
ncbi:MAG TPA: DNA polymerase III subunit gamma/tau [Candidatus Paceibacterota bacterium]|nr:DNA polymerase III subunit gamma/tau [Candidatus Paceibacterota bacterium]